mgnify:CR=1
VVAVAVEVEVQVQEVRESETEAEPKPQNELFEIRGTDMVTLPRLHLVLLVGTGTENENRAEWPLFLKSQ